MANFVSSPNMSLPVPVVGVDPGPDYATNLNNSLNIIDAHNHSIGSGVQITPSGININSNLSFAGSSATNLLAAAFGSQASVLSGTNFLSFIGGNLYVNDGSGNQIPITASGGIAGTPGSIGSLVPPASATYNSGSKTFIWATGSGSAAMDSGSITIRETNVLGANGITITSPTGLGADYQLTLPAALPGSTLYLTASATGLISYSSADSIGLAMTSIASDALSAVRTRSTGTSVAVGGVAISAASGTFTTTSANVDVPFLSVTITTSGRPVWIGLIADPSAAVGGGSGYLGCEIISGVQASASFALLNGATAIGRYALSGFGPNGNNGVFVPVSSLATVDFPVAGTYTYKIQASSLSGVTTTVTVKDAKLVAYEL